MEGKQRHIFDDLKVRLHRDLTDAETDEMRRLLKENGAILTASKDPDVLLVVRSFDSVRRSSALTFSLSPINQAAFESFVSNNLSCLMKFLLA